MKCDSFCRTTLLHSRSNTHSLIHSDSFSYSYFYTYTHKFMLTLLLILAHIFIFLFHLDSLVNSYIHTLIFTYLFTFQLKLTKLYFHQLIPTLICTVKLLLIASLGLTFTLAHTNIQIPAHTYKNIHTHTITQK